MLWSPCWPFLLHRCPSMSPPPPLLWDKGCGAAVMPCAAAMLSQIYLSWLCGPSRVVHLLGWVAPTFSGKAQSRLLHHVGFPLHQKAVCGCPSVLQEDLVPVSLQFDENQGVNLPGCSLPWGELSPEFDIKCITGQGMQSYT